MPPGRHGLGKGRGGTRSTRTHSRSGTADGNLFGAEVEATVPGRPRLAAGPARTALSDRSGEC